jgi:hypothetical protein
LVVVVKDVREFDNLLSIQGATSIRASLEVQVSRGLREQKLWIVIGLITVQISQVLRRPAPLLVVIVVVEVLGYVQTILPILLWTTVEQIVLRLDPIDEDRPWQRATAIVVR